VETSFCNLPYCFPPLALFEIKLSPRGEVLWRDSKGFLEHKTQDEMGAFMKLDFKNILLFNFIGFCIIVTNSQNRRRKKENKTLGNNIILFTKPC
jgi:hypothetical protein